MPRRLSVPVFFALVSCAVLVGVVPGIAQNPEPPSAADAARFAPPAPPAPPEGDSNLFPAPGSVGPAPPVKDLGELRSAGGATRAGRLKKNGQGGSGRFGGNQQSRAVNPMFQTAAGDPVEVRIAYRRAETEAKRDPLFADLQRRADLAKDDEERRALLRQYYSELFVRVQRLNRSPALATHIATLTRAAEQRYAPKRRTGGYDERVIGRERGGQQR